ncbi:TPA: type VI secretion system-associated protein TagO [Enterobacter chengduensis]|nr:type VI secretion system-associated protein TagO [Enterobacter chengduensis]
MLLLPPQQKKRRRNHLTDEVKTALLACRQQSSPLPRLQCYDQAWHPEINVYQADRPDRYWLQIMEQEKQRQSGDPVMILKTFNTEGSAGIVMLTVPGNGNYPARAIFAISCIENITRMQIAFTAPQGKGDQMLEMHADGKVLTSRWFWRGSGYRLEASRGLQGIAEIQQLFGAKELVISSDQPALKDLRFRIDGLKQALEPLRQACHW